MSTLKKPTTGTKMESIGDLRAKAMAMEPVVRIGKSGMTDSVVKEIKKQVQDKKLIKVKMLKSFIGGRDKKDVAKEIAEKTGSMLVHTVGFVAVLAKK